MLKRHWAAVLLFLALTLILTNPLALHVWNAVEDKQDALLNTWIMAWVGHAAIANPFDLYNANIFYPYRDTLAFSEVLLPQGLLALPPTLAGNNPILSYNLVLLAMLWLNAFAMYLFTLEWTHSRGAGWVAGAIYAFNPFNLGNLAQIQLLSLGWLPLAMIYLRRILGVQIAQRSVHRSLRDIVLFALFFVLQSLSSFYYALLGAFAVGVYIVWWICTERFNRHTAGEGGRAVFRLALAGVLIALVLTPLLLPYFAVQRDLGLGRKVEESEPFSANLKQFTEVAPENVIYGRGLAPNPVKFVGGYPLDDLFPGLIALGLAGVGLISARQRREKWFWLGLLAAAFLLALGPRLYLTADTSTSLTLPYRWLYDIFPLLQALRAPVRFEVLIMFALAALAGLGIATLAEQRLPAPLVLGAVFLIAVEYLAVPAANTMVVPVASEIPAVYKWLAAEPPGVALELPMMGEDAQNPLQADITRQYLTTYHWHPTPDGFSGFFAPRLGEIRDEMESFPSARAISLMQALDVRYLLLSKELAGRLVPPVRQSGARNAGLIHLADFGDTTVYRVEPPFFNASQLSSRLFLPQPAQLGAPYTAYLLLVNSIGWPFSVKPTDRLELTARWSDGQTEDLAVSLPLVTEYASVIPIRLHVPGKLGKFGLDLRSGQGVLGEIHLSGDVVVGQDSSQQVVLPLGVSLQEALNAEYARGGSVPVRLVWEPFNRMTAYYSVSVRVVDAQGNKVSAIDREPRGQTFLWKAGEPVGDEYDLRLPPDLAAGSYRVELLMYQPETDTSALLLDGQFNPQPVIVLGEFQVR